MLMVQLKLGENIIFSDENGKQVGVMVLQSIQGSCVRFGISTDQNKIKVDRGEKLQKIKENCKNN